jgi:hypothetical protein
MGEMVAMMGVAAPAPLSLTTGHQSNRSLASLVHQGRLPLVPWYPPGPGSTGSRPGAIATAIQE